MGERQEQKSDRTSTEFLAICRGHVAACRLRTRLTAENLSFVDRRKKHKRERPLDNGA